MIRPITPADAAAAAELIQAAFAAIEAELDPPPSALQETRGSVAAAIAAGGGAVWEQHGLQGCVLWRPTERGLYVGRLSVRPGWQGQGIGSKLLISAEAEARRACAPRLLLEVRLALGANRRLFAAAGFRETKERAHPGYQLPTFVEAEKDLGSSGR